MSRMRKMKIMEKKQAIKDKISELEKDIFKQNIYFVMNKKRLEVMPI